LKRIFLLSYKIHGKLPDFDFEVSTNVGGWAADDGGIVRLYLSPVFIN
jgi:hypothetical protein